MHNFGGFQTFWTFMIVVALLGTFQKLVQMKIQAREAARMQMGGDQELLKRLEKIEQRIANLETIVLEREKKNDWEKLF